jgi:hypothetical protein
VKNARVIIQELNRYSIKVGVLPPPQAVNQEVQEFLLSRISFEFNPNRSSWTVVRRQFLLRLAYATMFNSSRRPTLDRAVLDLRQGVFAHGQLYTRLIRIRQRGDGRVLFGLTNVAGLTNNVVSQGLLL